MIRPASRGERGAASVEFAIVVPALVLVIGLVIAAGRLAHARVAVQQWADSAARTASIARDAGAAQSRARAVVASDAAHTSVSCGGGWSVSLDTGAFGRPAGQPGAVDVRVVCPVPLADLVPGLPGTILVEGRASSTLDRYRGRR
ncbi:MAG: TadE/TadG family type IV pilus assembly protein [Actinomycetes bacterium]